MENWNRCSRRSILATAGILFSTACTSTARTGVYNVDLDDPAPTLIGETPGPPVWSPDGETLVWPTERGVEIWDAATRERELLVADSIAGLPAFSPDGSVVAYVRSQNPELILFNVADHRVEQRIDARSPGTPSETTQVLDIGGPSWSPDGRQLAFSCWDGAGDEICVLEVATSEVTQLTRLSEEFRTHIAAGDAPNATANMGPPAWSPDGARIAAAAYPERRGAASGLFVIDVEKGSARRLSDLQPNSVIVWAANSDAVLFSAMSRDRSDVFQVSLAGGAPTNVTRNLAGVSRNPALLADGDIVAATGDGAIVVLNGGRQSGRIHLAGVVSGFPAARPGRNEISFVATPDLIQSYRAT